MTDLDAEEVVRIAKSTKDVRLRRMLGVIGTVFIISLVGAISASLASYFTLRSAAEDGTVLAQQIQEKCNQPGYTDPDLAPFCPQASEIVAAAPAAVKADPVPGPPGPSGEAGATGESGLDGEDGADAPPPTDQQVRAAVRNFCTSTGRCRGADGSDATPAQVATAVATFCDSRGQCRGPNGEDGTDGTDGKDAPPITQTQIVSAVTTYCASNNNCRGPAGVDGKDGQDGEDSNVPGPQGSPGVVQVSDNCEPAPSGQVISDFTPSYNPDTQTITFSCSYKDDAVGELLQNGSNNEQ